MAGKVLQAVFCLAGLICGVAPALAQDAGSVTYGDWEQHCNVAGRCVLSQANADAITGDIRMRTEISLDTDDQVLFSVTVPASVLLTEGPWLTVDGVFIGELTYTQCPNGCRASIIFTREEFSLVHSGERGVITVSATGRRIGMILSLDGLAEGVSSTRVFKN